MFFSESAHWDVMRDVRLLVGLGERLSEVFNSQLVFFRLSTRRVLLRVLAHLARRGEEALGSGLQ